MPFESHFNKYIHKNYIRNDAKLLVACIPPILNKKYSFVLQ